MNIRNLEQIYKKYSKHDPFYTWKLKILHVKSKRFFIFSFIILDFLRDLSNDNPCFSRTKQICTEIVLIFIYLLREWEFLQIEHYLQ